MPDTLKANDALIRDVCASLHDKAIALPLTGDVIRLVADHQVQNIIYKASKAPELQRQFNLLAAQSIAQEYALDELINYFEDHNLYIMPIKGVCTKKRYPESYLRTMNDIDILCLPEQSKDVRQAIQSLGYGSFVEGRKHDSYSMPPYITLEIHRDLVDGDNKFYNYYRDIWKRCKPKAGCRYVYEMSLEDEYIFNFVHLVEHFKEGGIGLRFLVDIYVYENVAMDSHYLKAELNKLELLDFYRNIRSLALYWFGTDEEKARVVFTPTLQELGDFILSGGLFGSRRNRADLNAGKGKIISFLHACFPGYASMKSMFPWLHPVLLPYAWLLRAVRVLIRRKGNVKYVWNAIMKGDSKNGKKLLNFYKSCGLKM